MTENTSNFGKFLIHSSQHSNSGYTTFEDKYNFVVDNQIYKYLRIEGCNATVINWSRDFYLLIPVAKVNAMLKTLGITMLKLFIESKYFHLDYKLLDTIYTAPDDNRKYNVFRIYFNNGLNKQHYYTFCFLRHLYYYESTLKDYFKDYKHDPIEKIYNLRCQGHSIFPVGGGGSQLINDTWFKSYIKLKNNGHFLDPKYNLYQLQDPNGEKGRINKVIFHRLAYYNYVLVDYETDMEIKDSGLQFKIYADKKHPRLTSDSSVPIFGSNYPLYKIKNTEVKIKVLSRHPSHAPLRELKHNKKVLLRLGSTTKVDKDYDICINNIGAINTTSNKLKMKTAFAEFKVPTPNWFAYKDMSNQNLDDPKIFPIVAKHETGSRGTGNYLLKNKEELQYFVKNKRNISSFIFEKFCTYSYEYRVHVSKCGVFMVWQKLRKLNTPDDRKWVYNNDTSVFLSPNNDKFREIDMAKLDKIALLALKSVGLDIGAIDIKMSKKGEFSIIEINSAPSIGDVGMEIYKKEILKLCAV